jgi:hypothetical protein
VHIETNSRKTGGFFAILLNTGGSKYFSRKSGDFLKLTLVFKKALSQIAQMPLLVFLNHPGVLHTSDRDKIHTITIHTNDVKDKQSKSIIGAPPMAFHSDFSFLAVGSLPRGGSQPSIHGKNFLQPAIVVPPAPTFLPAYR